MKNEKFKNKKIGIWGFGVVGRSALNYFKKFSDKIQILDKKEQKINPDQGVWIRETEASVATFLQENEIIIPSPGIKLHKHKKYHHKILAELDIFEKEFSGKKIGISGTVGKTTITTLLSLLIPKSIAAGNIGYAMLNSIENKDIKTAVLELSSFQLQYSRKFIPDVAIWTNFYPNHLDHHCNEQEYFEAKCQLLANQKEHQIALIPENLIEKITAHLKISSQIYLTSNEEKTRAIFPTFFIKNNQILLKKKNKIKLIFDNFNKLPNYTFNENWLTIIAALHLNKTSLSDILELLKNEKAQEHRVEYLGTHHGMKIFNDSKSTVWQATKKALDSLNGESCSLILGGLSKGTDRSPLIKSLKNQPIKIFSFGAEAEQIKNLCLVENLDCKTFKNLDEVIENIDYKNGQKNLLFSPGGTSFDLFKNYQERGNHFKKLIKFYLC